MPTFTHSTEAQYADRLRTARDRTDDAIRDEFVQPVDDVRVARARAEEKSLELNWTRGAIDRALASVINVAGRESAKACHDDSGTTHAMEALCLEGAEITITVKDLGATATLVLPDEN